MRVLFLITKNNPPHLTGNFTKGTYHFGAYKRWLVSAFLEYTRSSVNLFLLIIRRMSNFPFLQHSENSSKFVSTKIPLIGPRPKNCCNIISCVSLIVYLVFSDSFAYLVVDYVGDLSSAISRAIFLPRPPDSRKNGEKDVLSDGTD